MEQAILQIKKAATGYKLGRKTLTISKELTASISKGKLVALLGPNGCGKSTLLRTIAGLQPTLDGQIHINQHNITTLKSKEKAKLLSLVLTDRIDSANLIVKDIIEIGRYPYTGALGVLQQEDKDIVEQAIQQCNLTKFTERMYSELSDGEKQRVMLARALAQDTPLMMLDEPTAHLDLPNRVELMKMLRDLAQKTQKAILLSTHELDLALQWCDLIWLMDKKGELRAGVPEDLVLNDDFSEVFSNNSFFFDKATGVFKMNRIPHNSIFLRGDKTLMEWTRRAVEREGFELTEESEKADYSIDAQDKKWIVTAEDTTTIVNSIEELLHYLSYAKKE